MELEIRTITKSFKKKKAVNQVSLTLHTGIHALLGANGSGKTTLIRMICGILPCDQGDILFDGVPIHKQYDVFCDKLGYMPQHFGYYPNYTVDEFLEYMSITKRIPKEEASLCIDHWIKELNLQDHRHKKMKNLSGGMLKRVGIIQALLNKPEILILDEPTAGLDPKERIVFRNLIASLSKKCLIILSTHIVSDIETIADDIIIMKQGSIIMRDTCQKLLDTMTHKVWNLLANDQDAKQLMNTYIIVKSHQLATGVDLRILSDEKPHIDAQEVSPDLDDLYLYHFNEEGDAS